MPLNNLHDLFEHELKDVYAAEKQILRMLEQMENQSREPVVREAVSRHVGETRAQIARIEGVFRSMNLQPGNATCAAVQGLAKEKHEFEALDPIAEVMDVYNVGAGVKTERYEISAYETLIDLAEKLGIPDVAKPLQENLREEVAMLETLKQASKRMSAANAKPAKGGDAQTRRA